MMLPTGWREIPDYDRRGAVRAKFVTVLVGIDEVFSHGLLLLQADLLLFSSSDDNGLCYIETAALDG